MKESGVPEKDPEFQQQQQITNRSAAWISTKPMSIPHSRDPVPPPLPSPRHLADISDGRSNRPVITQQWGVSLAHENYWGSDSPQGDIGKPPADNDDRSIYEPDIVKYSQKPVERYLPSPSFSQPSRADIDTFLGVVPNVTESEAILLLEGNNNDVEQAIGEYFGKDVWNQAEFSSDREGTQNDAGLWFDIQVFDDTGPYGQFSKPPSRPPSGTSNKSPFTKIIDLNAAADPRTSMSHQNQHDWEMEQVLYVPRQEYGRPLQESGSIGLRTFGDNNAAPSQPILKVPPYSAIPRLCQPQTQYDTPRPLHRSRGNSFDGRYQTTRAPPPAEQNYVHAPDRLGTPLSTQYKQQHPGQERYPPRQDAEGRIQEDVYYRRHWQREMDERRLMDDQGYTASLARSLAAEYQNPLDAKLRREELDVQKHLEDARRF